MRSSSFWSGFRTSSHSSATTSTSSERSRALKPTADPLEAKREQALLQSTAAKLVMTRRKVEQMHDALVERDKSQAEITTAAVELIEQLTSTTTLEAEILETIAADLGDLQLEALRVTR